jgi:hypothetical protein
MAALSREPGAAADREDQALRAETRFYQALPQVPDGDSRDRTDTSPPA